MNINKYDLNFMMLIIGTRKKRILPIGPIRPPKNMYGVMERRKESVLTIQPWSGIQNRLSRIINKSVYKKNKSQYLHFLKIVN